VTALVSNEKSVYRNLQLWEGEGLVAERKHQLAESMCSSKLEHRRLTTAFAAVAEMTEKEMAQVLRQGEVGKVEFALANMNLWASAVVMSKWYVHAFCSIFAFLLILQSRLRWNGKRKQLSRLVKDHLPFQKEMPDFEDLEQCRHERAMHSLVLVRRRCAYLVLQDAWRSAVKSD
jgi:hypothetical protein